LLGVPGLINAYKTAAALAIQTTPVIQKPVTVNYNLQFDYTQLNTMLAIIKQYKCVILRQDLQLFCVMDISIPKRSEEDVIKKLNNTGSVTVTRAT